MSIARTWSGATRAEDADRYLEVLRRTGLRDLAATEGNEGVLCFRHVDGERAEFTVVSLWRNERDVEAFSGTPRDRAVFYPEDDRYLVRRDETVRHHEVVFSGRPSPANGAPAGPAGLLNRLITWWSDWSRRSVPFSRPRS